MRGADIALLSQTRTPVLDSTKHPTFANSHEFPEPLANQGRQEFLLAFYAFTIYVQIEFLVSDSLDFNKIFPR